MISNAADTKLNENPGTLPDMDDAINNWFQNMVFTQIKKSIVNSVLIETPYSTSFQGVMQPFSPKQLMIKPEGQRAWSWYWVHAEPSLVLKPDERVKYLGKQYRVMAQNDYTQYGYVEYHLILDYEGLSDSD